MPALPMKIGQTNSLDVYSPGTILLARPCTIPESMEYTDDGRPRYLHHVTIPQLYFFKSNSKKQAKGALLIFPGGGYGIISIENEGRKVAERFHNEGFDVFVLKYRTPNFHCQEHAEWAALTDAMVATERIKNLGYSFLGIIGFSAGGHLAASVSTIAGKNPWNKKWVRPDVVCLVYPVISMQSEVHAGSKDNLLPEGNQDLTALFSLENQVHAQTPPTLIIHATDDEVVSFRHAEWYFHALIKEKIPSALHLFPSGGHAFGIGPLHKPDAPDWIPLALPFFSLFNGNPLSSTND